MFGACRYYPAFAALSNCLPPRLPSRCTTALPDPSLPRPTSFPPHPSYSPLLSFHPHPTPAVLRSLFEALRRAHADPAVKAVVLTGANNNFCAGFDISQFQNPDAGSGGGIDNSINDAICKVGERECVVGHVCWYVVVAARHSRRAWWQRAPGAVARDLGQFQKRSLRTRLRRALLL